MDIESLNQDLLELNRRMREAFSHASGLSKDQTKTCRWLAMKMPCLSSYLSTTQEELVARLETVVEFAGEHNLEDQVVAWCMAAAEDDGVLEEPRPDRMAMGPLISEFVREYVPLPAKVLDVASGSGWFSRPLAAQGYTVSLLDPATPFLEGGLQRARTAGVEQKIQSLICGTFADLGKLETASYDICLCIGAMLYAHPREQAEQILSQFSRIASNAVIVEVGSKYGLILQLGVEFDVSASAIQQILAAGVTPPAKPESCRTVYSCFSSTEFRRIAQHVGLKLQRLVGCGIIETLELGASKPIPADEALKIQTLLQNQEEMIDSFPSLLALCIKDRP